MSHPQPQQHIDSSHQQQQHTPTIIKGDALIFGWNDGQLGLPTKQGNMFTPTKNAALSALTQQGIKSIACGAGHNIIITADDRVFAFGQNRCGQLGLGHQIDQLDPQEIKFALFETDPVVQVACGDRHTVFVTKSGKCFSCGANYNGQCGTGDTVNKETPTPMRFLADIAVIVEAYCGGRNTIVRSDQGELFSCGMGLYGALGNGVWHDMVKLSPINVSWKCLSVSMLEFSACALSVDFELYEWGGHKYREGIDNEHHPDRNGIPRFVCKNIAGRRIRSAACGSHMYSVRTSDGSVFQFGTDLDGTGYIRHLKHCLDEYGNFKEDDSSLVPDELVLKNKHPKLDDKHIVKTGTYTLYKNCFLPSKIVDMCQSKRCSYFVTEEGKLLSIGIGKEGELGVGPTVKTSDYPVEVPLGKPVKKVVCGYWHCIAIV